MKITKILTSNKNFKYQITVLMIFSIITTFIIMLMPQLEGKLVDSLVYNKSIDWFIKICILLLVVGYLRIIISYVTNRIAIFEKQKTTAYLNREVITNIYKKDSEFILSNDLYYLHYLVHDDINTITKFFFETFISFVTYSLSIVYVFAYLFFSHNQILWTLIIFIPVYIFIYFKFDKRVYDSSYQLTEKENRYKSSKSSIYVRFLDIKRAEKLESDLFKLSSKESKYIKEVKKNFHLIYAMSSLKLSASLFFQILFFIIAGISVIQGNLTVGVFIVLMQFFSILLSTIDNMFLLLEDYQSFKVSCDRINSFLLLKNDHFGKAVISSLESIELIDFNHFFQTDSFLYRNAINIKIKKKNIYSIIGENGVGKSTLLNCITGLYLKNNAGEIIFNSVTISEIDLIKFRKEKLSTLSQEVVFSDELVVDYISGYLDGKCIENILKIEVYRTLFNGDFFNICNHLQKEMKQLSLGERKLIQLFCCLAKENIDLYILDEPTTNLNAKLVPLLKNLLDYLSEKSIILVVSHDPVLISETIVIDLV